MAQNEMRAKPALPERVRSMEGLGVTFWTTTTVEEVEICTCVLSLVGSVPYKRALEQWSFWSLALFSELLLW